MKVNNRLNYLDDYHFKTIEEMIDKKTAEGKKIINLSIGDPDLSINKIIVDELINALNKPMFNSYPPYSGIDELKEGVIHYYDEIYNVKLLKEEVAILIGSKEGISNIIPALCDINDIAIIPEPGYAVYKTCCLLWGVKPFAIALRECDNYYPNIPTINEEVLKRAKMFIINYPNNPTGAIGNLYLYKDLLKLCNKYNIILCNDGAYNDIIEPNTKPISLLQVDDKKTSIEFGSFSKTFNMTGFRIGYAVGNKEAISSLIKVKSNQDSGQFKPIQYAAVKALSIYKDEIIKYRDIYFHRRAIAEKILQTKNIKFFSGKGTFYIWCKTPKEFTTHEFTEDLIDKYGIVVTPGYIFGNNSYDYFRISLTQDINKIQEFLSLIKKY